MKIRPSSYYCETGSYSSPKFFAKGVLHPPLYLAVTDVNYIEEFLAPKTMNDSIKMIMCKMTLAKSSHTVP